MTTTTTLLISCFYGNKTKKQTIIKTKMSRKKYEKYDDLSYLHDELKKEVQEDKLYWVRNDAKIRAITSVQSYDEFRNIVDAAHLTPISKNDNISKMEGQISWNRALHK